MDALCRVYINPLVQSTRTSITDCVIVKYSEDGDSKITVPYDLRRDGRLWGWLSKWSGKNYFLTESETPLDETEKKYFCKAIAILEEINSTDFASQYKESLRRKQRRTFYTGSPR